MASSLMDFERKTLLVQFIAVEPLTFYATSDGTDLIQDILRSKLARPDADIFGQEGSLSIDENGEFLTFEPADTKNRTLHLPIEHLAYCGALRRMRRAASDQRDSDQIHQRDFENVDLANRYAQHIIGPPIFAAVFHGFDNALCYTFVTQSADDACLLVMKLMRTFRQYEQQGQINQGSPSQPPINSDGSPSPVVITHGSPLLQSSQPLFTNNQQISMPPIYLQTANTTSNMYLQNPPQDDLIQRLLSNPNFHLVNQPYASHHIDNLPIISAPSSSTQQNLPVGFNSSTTMLPHSSSTAQLTGRSTPLVMRSSSPPIIGIPNAGLIPSYSLGNTLPPQVIHKPTDQEITYKQNIIVRWLKPPTPPPSAPIIIREIQAPPEVLPPIIYRQMPTCPPTPPPIIIRERPTCHPPQPPLIIQKHLPPVCQPRQVIVERCAAPPPKPQPIIYEKCVPCPQPPRQVIVKRTTCQPSVCAVPQQQIPRRRLVREIIRRQCPPTQPALVCTPQQRQQIIPGPSQVTQQMVPVFATRRNIIQPKGIRIIRQVIGPAQPSGLGQMALQQQPQQLYSPMGSPFVQASSPNFIQ